MKKCLVDLEDEREIWEKCVIETNTYLQSNWREKDSEERELCIEITLKLLPLLQAMTNLITKIPTRNIGSSFDP